MKTIAVVVPCFNEELVIHQSCAQISLILDRLIESGSISPESSVVFVDDGSQDNTWAIVQELASRSRRVHGIKLSKNCGHQNALLAGLLTVPGDAIISIDADLQDDINVIDKMIALYGTGIDIVFAVRSVRQFDKLFKRWSASGFYRVMGFLGIETIRDHADYRLMSRRALDALCLYQERNLFLRGLIPQLGFSTAVVTYERQRRLAGETKYNIQKMLALAINGITSFSIAPLRAISVLGIIVSLIAFSVGVWALFVRLFSDIAVPGWASTVIPLSILGGIQLLSLGVIGEYIGKTYLETKRRPRYIIEKTL